MSWGVAAVGGLNFDEPCAPVEYWDGSFLFIPINGRSWESTLPLVARHSRRKFTAGRRVQEGRFCGSSTSNRGQRLARRATCRSIEIVLGQLLRNSFPELTEKFL